MTEGLKPCPFCGGEAYIVPGAYRDGGYIENFACVKCTKCGANGDTFSECLPFDVVERMAEDAWNRRAERTCSDVSRYEFFKCSECGHGVEVEYDDSSLYDGNYLADCFDYCPYCGARVIKEEL